MNNQDKAELIWKRVYKDLYGRSGIDWAFDDIDDDVRGEMDAEIVALITKTLNELDKIK